MTTTHCKVLTFHKGYPPIKSHNPVNTWSSEAMCQIKLVNLHYNNYGPQTCQGGDITRGAPTHKVTSPFYNVVLRSHMTNENFTSATAEDLWAKV